MALATESASAQTHARFHYHHLESFLTTETYTQAVAINNDHVIVGDTTGDGIAFSRAFVWVRCPRPDLGLLTAGMHDLHTIAEFATNELSVATDVNLAGRVVGYGGPGALEIALVWDLPSASEITLGTLGGFNSYAQAINDASPFEVVGWSEIRTPGVDRAFRWTNGTMRQLFPFETDTKARAMSNAHDINTRSGLPSLVSGRSFDTGTAENCGDDEDIGTTWENNAVAALAFPGAWGNPEDGIGRGVNDAGNIVGEGTHEFVLGECRTHAFFYPSATSLPVILPMPTGQENDESTAHAITEPTGNDALEIVGRNLTTDRALLWERANGTNPFTVVELNDEIDDPTVVLREAVDVSDDGWIVGRTLDTAFLLIPIDTCWGELTGDSQIGPFDLAQLLAQWGACANCPCAADLNLDNEIGPADLAVLLAAWGPCTEQTGHWNAGAPQPGANEPAWIEEVKLWLTSIDEVDLAAELHLRYYGG